MDKVLGILMLAGYITAVVGLASAITFAVIRIFPTDRNPKKSDKPEKPSSGDSTGGGSLFRRSKRGET